MFCFVIDFTFSSEACGAGAASGGGGGGSGGGRGSSLDQDCLGGSVACEEHEVASLTTLHLDSETSSLSHTVTVTGNAHNEAALTTTKLFKQFLKVLCGTSIFTVLLFSIYVIFQVLRVHLQCILLGAPVLRHPPLPH